MKFSNQEVLALIPAFNEQDHIQSVVQATRIYLPVMVVDDGSVDATADVARVAGARVIEQHPNQGKGMALITGFRFALQNGFQAVLTLDADGQHDPNEIPKFLEVFALHHSDLVIGRRDFQQMPFIRRLSNTLGTKVFSWALGQKVADNQSGYRLISARLIQALLDHPDAERGFEFEVEMIVQCVMEELSLDWVPIRTIYADEKSHIQPLRHLAKFLQVSLRTRQRIQAQNK